jgi:hypothetical protein
MLVPLVRRSAKGLALAAPLVLACTTFAAAATASGSTDPLSLVTGPSPFKANCNGAPQIGTVYPNSEVEPHLAVNPTDKRNLIAAWQQDRWSNGGAQGQLTAYSKNGGKTWRHAKSPPFGRCQGGGPENGGDYERVTDPWITFGPNGAAYQIALSGNQVFANRHAVLLSKSRDGGRSWGPVKELIVDEGPLLANDKETVTADPTDKRFVYATWWRNEFRDGQFRGPALFTRSTDGGRSWKPAREIFDSGSGLFNQAIGNQVVVEPNGDLINGFMWITGDTVPRFRIVAMRSKDHGRSWGRARKITELERQPVVTDPRDDALVRTGDIIPDFAADPRRGKRRLFAVWQDTRFTGQSQIALSRSNDGGRSWSAPARVSANPDVQAFNPAVEVNRKGDVAVSYYDFNNDTLASTTLATDYWIVRSSDGGRTFSRRKRMTAKSFDLRTAPVARGPRPGIPTTRPISSRERSTGLRPRPRVAPHGKLPGVRAKHPMRAPARFNGNGSSHDDRIERLSRVAPGEASEQMFA